MDRRAFLLMMSQIPQLPSRPLSMEDEVVDPNIPTEVDPFDLTLCNQLPNVITAEEDRILRHILRITCSDYQMRDRAYDSIVCMWKKKIYDLGGLPNPTPQITSVSPNSVPIVPEFPIQFLLTVNGTNFMPGAKLFWGGVEKPILTNTGTQITANMEIYPMTNTEVYRYIGRMVAIRNPDGKSSNSMLVSTENLIYGNGPYIQSVTPNPVFVPIGGGSFDLTVTGQNFAYPYNNVRLYLDGRGFFPKPGFSTSTSMVVTCNVMQFVSGQPHQVQVINGETIFGPGTSIQIFAA